GFRSIMNRFDTTLSSWKGWNYLAFAVLFLKKIHKSQKFK
ncbi:MAG: IS5/IS1182 family transposase, partial [Muribaculaceae bacterium]|nr:IS5/IS1182 family transposase [Muribaculaceae bacterium]